MAKSPFVGKLDLDQMHMQMQRDRQDSFEHKIIEHIFRDAGVSPAHLRMHAKRINQGTAENQLNMIWFNHFANYPVRLAARRFHSKRRFSEVLRDMRLGTGFDKSAELCALVDVQDGWPEDAVAFITRYPDWADDLVFHRVPLDESVQMHPDQFRYQRSAGEWLYTLEPLSVLLDRTRESWVLADVFTL